MCLLIARCSLVADDLLTPRYAFDIITRSNSPFLANKRLFATVSSGIPDGIKCDLSSNVYSGCGDGLNVWSSGGSLIGKVVCPGGVANFCFTRKGEMMLLNETKAWVVKLDSGVQGALLWNMKIEVE
jgi:gluconolactonase